MLLKNGWFGLGNRAISSSVGKKGGFNTHPTGLQSLGGGKRAESKEKNLIWGERPVEEKEERQGN